MNFFEQFNKQQLISAHRGFRALYPENSLLSFENSINKCDFLEFDVQFSKDNIPIIFHDNKLLRTSNAKALKNFKAPYYVWDYTFEQLQELDIGSWFYDCDPFFQHSRIKRTKKIQRVMSLEQMLQFAQQHDIAINIEIKYKNTRLLQTKHLHSIVQLINKYDFVHKTLVSSFCHDYIKIIKELNPSIATAALAHKKYPNDLVGYLQSIKVDAYHINQRLATKKLIKMLIEHGIVVNVYTINNKQLQEKLFRFKVRAIFTDFL